MEHMHQLQRASEISPLPVHDQHSLHTAVLTPVHYNSHLTVKSADIRTLPFISNILILTDPSKNTFLSFVPPAHLKMPQITFPPWKMYGIQHIVHDHKQMIHTVELKGRPIADRLDLPLCNPVFVRIKT